MSFATILPMAFVMIAGPQIISSVFFATSERWARDSLAYIGGAAISVTFFVTAAWLVVKGIKSSGSHSEQHSANEVTSSIILALLVLLTVVVFRGRNKSEPPKWMGKLQTATPRFALTLGILLLGVFPTDIITAITYGSHVARHGDPWVSVVPFVGLTLALLAIPAMLIVLLGKRAKVVRPARRDWMNTNSWIVSELVIFLFIGITISNIASA